MRRAVHAVTMIGFVVALVLAAMTPTEAAGPVAPVDARQERLVVFEAFMRPT